MRTGIYAIYDIVAEMFIGGLQLHKSEAAAVRVFDDLARDPQTGISRHTADYNLLFLGWLEEDQCITPDDSVHGPTITLAGKQWLLANRPTEPRLEEPPEVNPHVNPSNLVSRETLGRITPRSR